MRQECRTHRRRRNSRWFRINGGCDILVALLSTVLLCTASAFADTSRGEKELRICTQNLHRFGDGNSQKTAQHKLLLAKRMAFAKCDVVALQELFGRSEREAERNIDLLAGALSAETKRRFTPVFGDNEHDMVRNGFLIAADAADLLSTFHFGTNTLPKLSLFGPGARFTREPLGALLSIKRKGSEQKREKLLAVTFHLKSRVEGWKDPAGLDFETVRMETAEAIRTWAKRLEEDAGEDWTIVLLGDRNSEEESASAAVLRGERALVDFRRRGLCSVKRGGEAECGVLPAREAQFADLFASAVAEGGGEELRSYRYRGRAMQLDEIALESDKKELVLRRDGTYSLGAVDSYQAASDHKLLWADFNF